MFSHLKATERLLTEDPSLLNEILPSNEFLKTVINTSKSSETCPPVSLYQQRLRPGTKKENLPIAPLMQLDFSDLFSLETYLKGLLANETSHPISVRRAKEIAQAPKGVDPWLWVYELVKQFIIDLNVLVVGMLEDACSSQKCPEMRANEWQYLCACHSPPQECAAIDYILHTLDHATALLCSNKYFPSKMSIPASSTRHFSSIMRRLYRIFSHAWYKHYDVFWKVENKISLYRRFMAVSEHYHFKYEHSSMVDEAYFKETKEKYPNSENSKQIDDNQYTFGNYYGYDDDYSNYKTPNRIYDNKENHDNTNTIICR